jgi:hypothetical protein
MEAPTECEPCVAVKRSKATPQFYESLRKPGERRLP